jgi:3-oxoacyl-[acyl-carrier protein] reductase
MSQSFAGRTVIVTGGGRGIGRGIALGFAAAGANVMLAARTLSYAEATKADIAASGGTAEIFGIDVKDHDQCRALIDATVARFGGIDIIVNNAGISCFSALDGDTYHDDWTRALTIMLTAHQRMVRAALPWLRQSDAARIVNIASTEGLGATPGDTPYVAAKTGVTGLTRGLAVDLGPDGITVNCICPGPIDTGMTAKVPDDHKIIFAKRRTALKRYGLPEEVANITLSLVLPAASYITGAIIPVDGGLMARNA